MEPLFEHQERFLVEAWDRPGFGHWWEMGTTKTRTVIENVKKLYAAQKIDGVLVCAKSGVYLNWERELKKWWPEIVPVIWRASNPSKSERQLKAALEAGGIVWFLMNVESMSRTKSRAVQTAVQYIQYFKGRVMLVVDESNLMGNNKAGQTKVLRGLGRGCAYRRVLSGTPGVETPLKLYNQLEFIAPKCTGMSYWQYQNHVGVMKTMFLGNRSFQKIASYRNIEWVKNLMRKHGSFIAKTDCHDLPPKLYEVVEVPLSKEHMDKYNSLRKYGMTELMSGRILPTNAMELLYQLHNVTSGFAKTESMHEWFSMERVTALMELLKEISGKAIIYTPSRIELAQLDGILSDTYGPLGFARFHGGIDIDIRNRDVDRFQTDPQCRWFLANQMAAGHGLTLTAASYVIYFRNAYSLEIRVQSEDRAHRVGVTHPVTIIDLVSPGTVDEHVLNAHKNKLDIASQIVEFLKRVVND